MEHLLFLHGALGSKDQLIPFESYFSQKFNVHLLNFCGHGGAPFRGEFSIANFADEVADYITANQLEKVSIIGYSMGGYVALYLAKNRPELVAKVITLGTKFKWDNEIAIHEVSKLHPEIIEQKVPKFAEALRRRHSPINWHDVLLATADMMLQLGQKNAMELTDYTTITTPVLCCIGDRDEMVSLEETVAVFNSLPNAQLLVLPYTKHPVEQINIEVFLSATMQFLLR
jgi:pimeloyl-ACP methyl ester carboxylesterase